MITKDTQLKMQTAKKMKGTLSDLFVYNTFVYKRIEDPEGKLKPGFHIYNVNSSWYEAFYTSKNKIPSDEAFGNTAYCCILPHPAEKSPYSTAIRRKRRSTAVFRLLLSSSRH